MPNNKDSDLSPLAFTWVAVDNLNIILPPILIDKSPSLCFFTSRRAAESFYQALDAKFQSQNYNSPRKFANVISALSMTDQIGNVVALYPNAQAIFDPVILEDGTISFATEVVFSEKAQDILAQDAQGKAPGHTLGKAPGQDASNPIRKKDIN